jgi:CBS-domain-containing membrane protein
MMNRHSVQHLPVVEDGKVCGIVSMWDLMKASNNAYQFENRLLKRYIQAWPDEHRGGGLKLVVNNKFRPPAENSVMPA